MMIPTINPVMDIDQSRPCLGSHSGNKRLKCVCQGRRVGVTCGWVGAPAFEPDEAGVTVGASVPGYCPVFGDLVTGSMPGGSVSGESALELPGQSEWAGCRSASGC